VHLSDLSISEFKGLFSNKKVLTEAPRPKNVLMDTIKPVASVTLKLNDVIEEKSTEELIRILQEKKRKLLMLQYASKELEQQQVETQKLIMPQN